MLDFFSLDTRRAIEQLPADCQHVVRMTFVLGLTEAEGGAMLGVTQQTYHRKLTRTQRLLRERLAERN